MAKKPEQQAGSYGNRADKRRGGPARQDGAAKGVFTSDSAGEFRSITGGDKDGRCIDGRTSI